VPLNARVLLVTVAAQLKNGVYQQTIDAVVKHTWFEFSGIEPNPTYDTLMQAQGIIKAEKTDYLLAVGGGSVFDGANLLPRLHCMRAMTLGIFSLTINRSQKHYLLVRF
jgi:NADP-dependent alcohol dehydrogenase